MENIMTQLEWLSKHVMRGVIKSVNLVGINNGQCPNNVKFEALCNKHVEYLGTQMEDCHIIISDKVGTKAGTTIEIVDGNIGRVEFWKIVRLIKIGTCLPMIIYAQNN